MNIDVGYAHYYNIPYPEPISDTCRSCHEEFNFYPYQGHTSCKECKNNEKFICYECLKKYDGMCTDCFEYNGFVLEKFHDPLFSPTKTFRRPKGNFIV